MREIYRIDVHDDYMPRGAPFPVWDNHPKDPARYGELPIGPHDPGYRNDGLGTGFPPDMPRPIITFHRPLGRVPPVDIYMASRDTFTVSERAKLVLESVDPEAFEFVEADTILPDGSQGPRHWIMDIVRTVNAIDEMRPGTKILAPGIAAWDPRGDNVFHEERLTGAHVFRLPGGYAKFCDGEFKMAFEAAKLVGVLFGLSGVVQ